MRKIHDRLLLLVLLSAALLLGWLLFCDSAAAQPPDEMVVRVLRYKELAGPPVTCNTPNKGVTYRDDQGRICICNGTGWNCSDETLADLGISTLAELEAFLGVSLAEDSELAAFDPPLAGDVQGTLGNTVLDFTAVEPGLEGVLEAEDLRSNCALGAPIEGDGAGGTMCGVDDTGPGGGGVGDFLCASTTAGQDIDAAAVDNLVLWNMADSSDGTSLAHSTTVNPERITAQATGVYLLDVGVAFTSAAARYNGILRARLNGTTNLRGRAKNEYVRNAGGKDEGSLHLSRTVALSAADYLEILVDREAGAGSTPLSADQSIFCLTRIK